MGVNELYKESEFCMNFENSELINYFVSIFKNNPNVDLRIFSDYEEVPENTNKKIDIVCLDGDKEELTVSFYGHQTSIFAKDIEIMLIDDNEKCNYTSSDTYKNVVYEGELRKLTHIEILRLILDIVSCFIGAKEISVHEEEVNSDFYYPKCNYV